MCLTDYQIEMERPKYMGDLGARKKGFIYVDIVWANRDGAHIHLFQIEKTPLGQRAKKIRKFLREFNLPTTYIYYSKNEKNDPPEYEFTIKDIDKDYEAYEKAQMAEITAIYPDAILTRMGIAQQKRLLILMRIINDIQGTDGASIEDIMCTVREHNGAADKVIDDIERLKNDGRIYERYAGRYRLG